MPGLFLITDRISWLLAIAAGLVLTALVGLTFVDVVLRYVFSDPILGSKDILQMGMVIVVFLGAPFTWRVGGHIVVDLLPDYRNPIVAKLRDLSVRLMVLVLFGLLAWQAWVRAEETALLGEATNMIELPYQPFFLVLGGAAALQSWILVLEIIAVATNHDPATKVLAIENEQ